MYILNLLHGSTSLSLLIVCLILVHLTHQKLSVEEHKNYNLIPQKCGGSYGDRIIGGSKVPIGKFPWLARLGYVLPKCVKKIYYQCGGVLISDQYVLTAAHCVQDYPTIKCPRSSKNVTFELGDILLGEYNSHTDPDCSDGVCAAAAQHFQAESTLIHPLYNTPEYANDITLIRLDKKADLNGWVSPICLPRSEHLRELYTGQFAEVAGWGTTDLNKPGSSPTPMAVKIPILELKVCMSSFSEDLDLSLSTQMCVGGEEGKDSCGGDSGGPLMYVHSEKGPPKYYVLGLVSFGVNRCGKKDKPAVYTRIAGYMRWILENMKP